MKLPTLVLLSVILSLGACANLMHTASINEAYKHYELQQYGRTLALISQAENAKVTTDETKAELTYLKAKTHEKMGQSEIAQTLYEYLVIEHENSQYAYLATHQLKTQ